MIQKTYTDKEGKLHTEYYNKKGKLLKKVISFYDKERCLSVIKNYDSKGCLLERTTYKGEVLFQEEKKFNTKGHLLELRTRDKEVYFSYGIFSKFFGKSTVFPCSEKRTMTDMRLYKILKNKALSFEEKRTQRRIAVAEYRHSTGRVAPVQKVNFALRAHYSKQR